MSFIAGAGAVASLLTSGATLASSLRDSSSLSGLRSKQLSAVLSTEIGMHQTQVAAEKEVALQQLKAESELASKALSLQEAQVKAAAAALPITIPETSNNRTGTAIMGIMAAGLIVFIFLKYRKVHNV